VPAPKSSPSRRSISADGRSLCWMLPLPDDVEVPVQLEVWVRLGHGFVIHAVVPMAVSVLVPVFVLVPAAVVVAMAVPVIAFPVGSGSL
jgi:hypothetical protein